MVRFLWIDSGEMEAIALQTLKSPVSGMQQLLSSGRWVQRWALGSTRPSG